MSAALVPVSARWRANASPAPSPARRHASVKHETPASSGSAGTRAIFAASPTMQYSTMPVIMYPVVARVPERSGGTVSMSPGSTRNPRAESGNATR